VVVVLVGSTFWNGTRMRPIVFKTRNAFFRSSRLAAIVFCAPPKSTSESNLGLAPSLTSKRDTASCPLPWKET
jgi:hypothetical protein